jgi:phosphatidylserine/phosphatidylglycerophosphate/cardiolipin synthase-like enzyme
VAAFAGYESIREELIRIGIEVYETKPDSQYSRELNTSELESTEEASVGIHAKSMLVDDDIVLIGTYNLDPRSANLNTECVLLVESPVLNSLLAETFYKEIKEENAWLVTLASNPDKEAGWFKRVLARLLRVVPVEVL